MNKAIDNKIDEFFLEYPIRSYKKGHILIYKDELPGGVYRLEKGRVRQYDITSNGDEVVVNMNHPPTFFPMAWALNGSKNHFFYEAASDIEVRLAPKENVVDFLKNNPDIGIYLLSRLYAGIDDFSRHKFYMMKGSAQSRTIMGLIMCCERYTDNSTDPYYTIKFTESELATMSGLTRETINREIKKLQKKGVVDVKNRSIIVKNKDELEQELEAAI